MKTSLFSSWKNWSDREDLGNLSNPGVYALAISDEDISDQQFNWIQQIVYFGMTNSVAGLKGRLKQFDNTIIGKTGHGGADRFLYDFPAAKDLNACLYVAVRRFKCDVGSNSPDDLVTMGNVAKAEYECFAEYVTIWGSLPKYNNKQEAPKFSKTQRAK